VAVMRDAIPRAVALAVARLSTVRTVKNPIEPMRIQRRKDRTNAETKGKPAAHPLQKSLAGSSLTNRSL